MKSKLTELEACQLARRRVWMHYATLCDLTTLTRLRQNARSITGWACSVVDGKDGRAKRSTLAARIQACVADTTASATEETASLSPHQMAGSSGSSGSSGTLAETAPGGNHFVSGLLEGNPYFSAGFGLMGVGAALATLRQIALRGSMLLRRRLLVTCEITSKDPSYLWFLQWMSSHSRTTHGGFGSRLSSHQLAVETKQMQRPDGSAETSVSLVPGPGTHYFRYRRAWFQVKRERQTMMDLNIGSPFETLTTTTLSRDRHLLASLLNDARELAKAATVGKTVIYTAWGPEWRPFGQARERRLLESVVLDDGVKETLVDDVTAFMDRGAWYRDRGIPYRRGYLLFGPPGSGKSSFVQALAGSLEYNICVLNLSERGLTDDKLNHLLANAPERAFLLLEDIDAAFIARASTADQGYSTHVTFSGLLNALDGVASSTSQRLLFMTTNHVERLDAALIRPGRVDIRSQISDATPNQALRLFTRFYTDASVTLRERFAAHFKATHAPISMAALQGHFIRHATRAEDAVDTLPEMIRNLDGREAEKRNVTPSMPNFA